MNYIPKFSYDSILDIDYDKLYDMDIRFLMFDLDNTIAPRNEKTLKKETIELFSNISKKFKVIILSNSLKKRVKPLANILNVEYISASGKPFKYGFKKALKKYHFTKEETALIGDQLITDVSGGNKFGITTILVKPISNYDGFFTRINRRIENKIKKKLGMM